MVNPTQLVEITSRLESEDPFLARAFSRTFNALIGNPDGIYEGPLSSQLNRDGCLGGSQVTHGSYLRSTLDILISRGIAEQRDGKYFLK